MCVLQRSCGGACRCHLGRRPGRSTSTDTVGAGSRRPISRRTTTSRSSRCVDLGWALACAVTPPRCIRLLGTAADVKSPLGFGLGANWPRAVKRCASVTLCRPLLRRPLPGRAADSRGPLTRPQLRSRRRSASGRTSTARSGSAPFHRLSAAFPLPFLDRPLHFAAFPWHFAAFPGPPAQRLSLPLIFTLTLTGAHTTRPPVPRPDTPISHS